MALRPPHLWSEDEATMQIRKHEQQQQQPQPQQQQRREPPLSAPFSATRVFLLFALSLTGLAHCASPKASKLEPSDLASVGQPSSLVVAPLNVSRCPRTCGNGRCDEAAATCVCYPGWRGDDCGLCGGKIRLNSTKGWLADAVGNYTVDSKCTWLIEAPSNDDRIRLHLKDFATECGWDHLYIFDGDSVFTDLKAVFSGLVRQDRYQVHQIPELVGSSGSMLLHFYSDVAYNMTGFNITFSVNDCPSERHDRTCSGHGSCDHTTGRCDCDIDYKGQACERPACPNNCRDRDGVERGQCLPDQKRCDCYEGWTGDSCSQSISHGFWRVLTPNGDFGQGSPTPRTSHAALMDSFGRMWVVGGETFTRKSRHMVAAYTLPLRSEDAATTKHWQEIHAKSDKGPSSRYGHSAVIHDQKIYMYGGTMRSGHVSRELWALDLDLLSWKRVETQAGQCMVGNRHKLCGPLHAMGHTANVIANRMIVIFGHSPKYGYLDTVQEYHFGSKEWSIIPAKGYKVRGGFGHTSVFDEVTNLIYVYGGYVSTLNTAAALSNDLYSFDPISRIWKLHASSPSYRYLHTAVSSSGLMLVFAGNTHNDTAYSLGAKCFSADFLAYDIVCDEWRSMENSASNIQRDIDVDLARFGHTAVMSNGSMLVHGGFHGTLRNDVLSFTPGQCEMHKTRSACLKDAIGVKCVWDIKKGYCRIRTPNDPKAKAGVAGTAICDAAKPIQNHSETCSSIRSCAGCVSTTLDCVWCAGENACKWRECQVSNNGGPSVTLELGSSNKRNNDLKLSSSLPKSPLALPSPHGSNQVVASLDQCPEMTTSPKEKCATLHTCHSCSAHEGCNWVVDKHSKCKESKRKSATSGANLTDEPGSSGTTCSASCSERTSCQNCTHGMCMWCQNLNLCIDKNAYLPSFPYGQCMEWTTQSQACPVQDKNDTNFHRCSGYNTCDTCRSNPSCGWCDDGTLTGLGRCLPGGASGPMKKQETLRGHGEWIVEHNMCPRGDGKSWHFTSCPACQCNGHSSCSQSTGVCDQPCQDNTEGDHCERCTKGFFGNAVNGGSCQECKCNGKAETCNHETGRCHCTTKGIVGDHCEKCDKVNHYFGDPVKDSCFYELAIDYQFTFNLSKPDDRHFTAINFKNTPTKFDVDVDFSVTCSVPSKLNLTYRFNSGKDNQENVIFTGKNCSSLVKDRFSKDKFVFGESQNTTFYIYVYDFQAPLWIIISFSQHPKLDLLQFFITFSSCFLALLVVAAVLWKIKQRYDRYRRRQRLFVEMEQMASRPFGAVFVECERLPDTTAADKASQLPPLAQSEAGSHSMSSVRSSATYSNSLQQHQHPLSESYSSYALTIPTAATSSSSSTTGVRKRKKRHRPSPIALEPCDGNRAAVLSLIVRLPTGGRPYAPPGYTGIAVASSLVTLGNHRKPSTDLSSRTSVDDPKGRKGRKGPNAQPADI